MSEKITVLDYSEYEKAARCMDDRDKGLFQFLKSFGGDREQLPAMNEIVCHERGILPLSSGQKVVSLDEEKGPVGVNTFAYLATMKSLTGSAYNRRYE